MTNHIITAIKYLLVVLLLYGVYLGYAFYRCHVWDRSVYRSDDLMSAQNDALRSLYKLGANEQITMAYCSAVTIAEGSTALTNKAVYMAEKNVAGVPAVWSVPYDDIEAIDIEWAAAPNQRTKVTLSTNHSLAPTIEEQVGQMEVTTIQTPQGVTGRLTEWKKPAPVQRYWNPVLYVPNEGGRDKAFVNFISSKAPKADRSEKP